MENIGVCMGNTENLSDFWQDQAFAAITTKENEAIGNSGLHKYEKNKLFKGGFQLFKVE